MEMMMNIHYPKPGILSGIPLDRHGVIEASAGTGKTYTIEHLFVEILLTRDVSVENILVVTYTEKAASELRMRVRRIIQGILDCRQSEESSAVCWEITGKLRLKLERALFSFDKAPIHTIHGFFQRVIMENAFTGGRLFDQTLTEARGLFSEEFRKVLRERIAREETLSAALSLWLEKGKSADQLEELLYKVHQKKCVVQPEFKPVDYGAEVRTVAALFRKELEPEAVRKLCKELKVHGTTVSTVIRKIENARDCFDRHRENTACLLEVPADDVKYLDTKLRPVLGEQSRALKALEMLGALLISTEAMLVQLCLPLVRSSLNQRKLREGLYDFDDMIGYLRQALKGPQAEALIRNLRTRYRYALIDESQDTDEVQWEIFRKIFYESSEGNRIYLIGDPKQAIYGFRGADVYTYLAARRDICGSSPPVPLDENFRSTGRLIEACNLLLDQKAEGGFFTGDQIRYDAPVKCGLPDLEAIDTNGRPIVPVTIIPALPGKSGKVTAAQYRQQIGSFIAQEIKQLLDKDPIALTGKNGQRTRINARDIFILVRAEREGREIAGYLREVQVPFAFYKQDGLFQTREAEEIRDLLAAVAEPQVRSKRLKAWMTRFFGVPLNELRECRDLPETEPLVRKLVEWHGLARKRDYRRLFTRIIDESGIVRRELFLEDNERSLTNFHHIFEILFEETARRSCDIAEVVMLLNAFISGTDSPARDNGNIQRLETEKEAVQIMTLHKSKGLEAHVVFLYGGFSTIKDREMFTFHDGGKRILHLGHPPHDVLSRAEDEEKQEHQRLLYVGMTRAKAKLYLPYIAQSPEDQRNRKDGPYNELNRRLDYLRRSGGGPPELFAWAAPAANRGISGITHAETGGMLPEWQPQPEHAAAADLDKIRQDHSAFFITSYTRIRQKQEAHPDEGAEDRDTEQSDQAATGWTAERIGGPAFGSAIHGIMERIPFDSFWQGILFEEWSEQQHVGKLCRDSLQQNGIDLVHLNYAQGLVYHALIADVMLGQAKLPGFWTLTDHARETEFLYPFPEASHPTIDKEGRDFRIERGYVKGFIDFLFRFNEKVYFLDWKTDILSEYSLQEMERHFKAHYPVQVKLYLLAMVKLMQCRSREAYESEFGGIIYCFLRGMRSGQNNGIYQIRPSWDDILAWEQELIRSEEYL